MNNQDDKITITLTLTEAQQKIICANSIERVFNTAIELITEYESLMEEGDCPTEPGHDELASISLQDLEGLKQPVTYIWNDIRNAVHTFWNNKNSI